MSASTINDYLASFTLYLAYYSEQCLPLCRFIYLFDLLQQHLPHYQHFSCLWYILHDRRVYIFFLTLCNMFSMVSCLFIVSTLKRSMSQLIASITQIGSSSTSTSSSSTSRRNYSSSVVIIRLFVMCRVVGSLLLCMIALPFPLDYPPLPLAPYFPLLLFLLGILSSTFNSF